MALIATNISQSYGHLQVLAAVSVSVSPGDRLALVGANGSGKSTLLRILATVEEPDSGRVSRGAEDELGYLPQTVTALAGSAIEDVIAASVSGLRQLERRMRELEVRMATPAGATAAVLHEYGEISSRFESRDGYELHSSIAKVLANLGVGYLEQSRPIAQLSGGERARVALATLLLAAPDILLLDEPTNDLDEMALTWLQSYVMGYGGGILFISHDRDFIDAVCTGILELDEHLHTITRYEGNYERYLKAKSAALIRQQQAYEAQQEQIRDLRDRVARTARLIGHNRAARDNDKHLYNFKGANVDRAVSRNVRAAYEQLERIQANPVQPPPQRLQFRATLGDSRIPAQAVAIEADQLSVDFSGRIVLDGVDCVLRSGDRICLIGPNGSGKTTLLRLLAQRAKPDRGKVRVRRGLRIGYLGQEPQLPDPKESIAQNIMLGLRAGGITAVSDESRGWLVRWGLIYREDLTKRADQLSVGQQRKVELGILIATAPDALLLDEPTNHLPLDVVESLEKAMLEFDGPVLIVTHDRRLIRQFPYKVWYLNDGRLCEKTHALVNP